MGLVPNDIPGVGEASSKPTLNLEFDPQRAGISSEEYYALTRIDGTSSLRDLILVLGLGAERGIEILQRLRELGAFLLEGETPEDVVPDNPGVELGELSEAERELMESDTSLDTAEQVRVLQVVRLIRSSNYFELFGVSRGADKKELKRAYFGMSKEFHPDRYYGKALGGFGVLLSEIFETVSKAFDLLTNDKTRREYEARLSGNSAANHGQTKEEHAVDLYQRACSEQAKGDVDQAVMLFRAVLRLNPKPRYLARAARALVEAGELEEAESAARQAMSMKSKDPSYYRVLAEVLMKAERLPEARSIVEEALSLKSENDALMSELRSDLQRIDAKLNQT